MPLKVTATDKGVEFVAVVTKGDIRRITAKLARFPKKLRDKMGRSAAREAAKVLQSKAKQIVAHDTGALEKSIKVRALPRKAKYKRGVGARVITGDKGFYTGATWYGGSVEFGNQYREPDSFLRHGMLLCQSQVVSTWHRVLSEKINATIKAEAAKP